MIKSSAPTRIDLAGGTLDIWPLYLCLDLPPTLNAAVNIYATVKIRLRKDRAIVVESRDLGKKARFASIQDLPKRHPLELILRVLEFYRPAKGVEIETDCQAPAGSGIAGSSALNIALNGALNRLVGSPYKRDQLPEIARNIETQVIRSPAGWQDYFPALNGGVQVIQPGIAGVGVEKLSIDLEKLNRRFVLCYSGKPRNSGINNWEVLKQALDGNKKVLRSLERIRTATLGMESSLKRGDLPALPGWFDKEWKARKELAPGITTPQIERQIAAAKKCGALAAKVCGAGGGGCVAFMVKEIRREDVARALTALGGRILDFKFVQRGLRVESS